MFIDLCVYNIPSPVNSSVQTSKYYICLVSVQLAPTSKMETNKFLDE